ncbi:MAG: amidohydrolase [Acidobacteria bacterium]|nr:amidohydrolase [Acidobacteriota bacterium]
MLVFLLLLMGAAAGRAQMQEGQRTQLLQAMDESAPKWGDVSRRIWEFAELGYHENKSSKLLQDELRAAGFRVTAGVAGAPTAFVAEWGTGKPVIGLMGEFDALPGLSQDAVAERKPLVSGGSGHGCGHNLFGAAVAFAAVTAKSYMEQHALKGTLRFYGTPAEEGGGGKIYMLRAGVFAGTDVVLTWHPGDANRADLGSSLANITAKFRFYGTAAHAAQAPWAGRSALDGVMLAGHAIDMLREHVPQETRLHYIVTKGGVAPNIVPDFAEVYAYARHPKMPVLDGIWERMENAVKGAAIATGTRAEIQLTSSVWDVLPNDALAALLQRNLKAVGGVNYTEDERAFALKLRGTFDTMTSPEMGSEEQVFTDERGLGASTDVGDVSYAVPTAQFTAATYVPGTPGHSWQSTACAGMSIGRKGMVVAAKTLALSTIELIGDSKHVEAARVAFLRRKAGVEYRSRIPVGAKPPLDYRGN